MKKAVAFLLFAVFSLSLCGCNSENNNISMPEKSSEYSQSSHGTTSAESSNVSEDKSIDYDIYISPGEPYSEGIYYTAVFYSEWLNLYTDIPYEMRLDEATVDAINELNFINREQGSIQEMMAVDSDNSKQVNIYVDAIADDETFEQFIKKHYQELRKSYKDVSVNGVQLSDSGDNFSTYTFLGENYLLNTRQSETRYNGKLTRATNWWDLFRMKGDRIIQIQCMATQNSGVKLEDLLSMFKTHEDEFDHNYTENEYQSSYDVYADPGAEVTWFDQEGNFRYKLICNTCGEEGEELWGIFSFDKGEYGVQITCGYCHQPQSITIRRKISDDI